MLKKYLLLSFLFIFSLTLSYFNTAQAATLVQRLNGRILLQVQAHGEAWYVNPSEGKRIYLKNGDVAYNVMSRLGLGITNANLSKIPTGIENRFACTDNDNDGLCNKLEDGLGTSVNNPDTDSDGFFDGAEVKNNYNPLSANKDKLKFDYTLASSLRGKILLQVESHGEAWYVNPVDGKKYYMPDGPSAYEIMRFLSLGITNQDLSQIPISNFVIEDLPEEVVTPPVVINSDTQNPSAPTNLLATATSTQITLTWNASTDNVGVSRYLIERSLTSNANFNQIATSNNSSYINSSLSANTKYYYRVRAQDAAGNLSSFSNIVFATTPNSTIIPATDTQNPSAPTNLVATATSTQITLTWNSSTDNVGVTGYQILRSTTTGGPYNQIATSNTNTYTNTALTAGSTYYYVVKAYDLAGNVSSNSNQAQATIATSLPTPQNVSIFQPYIDKISIANIVAPENTGYIWYRNGNQVASGVSPTTFLAHFDNSLLTVNNEEPLASSGVSYSSSKFGQGLRGKVEYPVANNLSFDEGTIEFWLSLDRDLHDGAYNNDQYLFSYINSSNYQKITMNVKTLEGILVFTVHSGASDPTWANSVQLTTSYNDIPVNEAVLLSMTYSKSNNKSNLYLNGFKIAQDEFSGFNFDPANSNLIIGNNNAVIDEFRILNKQLSDEEVKNNYDRGFPFADNEVYYSGLKNLNDNLQLSINLQGANYTANSTVKNAKINNISPNAYVLSNRSSINLNFNTAANATCRYGKMADNFSDLPYAVSGTGTSHSINYNVVSIVSSHNFYIKCQSGSDGDDYAFYRRIRVLPNIDNNWPKIGSITWGNNITDSEALLLAKYDMISLAKDNAPRSSLLTKIKENNPQIILLPYVNAPDNNISWGVSSFVHQDLFEKLSDTWRLRNSQGQYMTNLYFPNVMIYNLLSSLPWAETLSKHVVDELTSRGDWDGVWFDVVDTNFWFLYDYSTSRFVQFPDFDLDGVNEDLNNSVAYNKARNIWADGMGQIMSLTRQEMGNDAIIVGNNGDTNAQLYNGKMWERFFYYHESNFTDNLDAFLSPDNSNSFTYWNNNTVAPHLNWNLFELDYETNYRRHRLGLAGSLLGGVYYNPANRSNYRQLYWYDEYWVDWVSGQVTTNASEGRGYLGQPVSTAYLVSPNIWRRDFEHGIVILNNSTTTANIDLGDKFRYIEGKQDSLANPGGATQELILNSRDARILLTTQENDPLIGQAR